MKKVLYSAAIIAGFTFVASSVGFASASSARNGLMLNQEFRGPHLEQKADVLNLSIEQLEQYRAEGKNFAEIAEIQGITREYMHTSMQGKLLERLNQAIANGQITQEQADAKLAKMQERFQQVQNGTAEPGPRMQRTEKGYFR